MSEKRQQREMYLLYTTGIKFTGVGERVTLMCDGSARGWLAGDIDGLASDCGTSVGDGLADARKADLNQKL